MQKTVVRKTFWLGIQKVEECLWGVGKLFINSMGNAVTLPLTDSHSQKIDLHLFCTEFFILKLNEISS